MKKLIVIIFAFILFLSLCVPAKATSGSCSDHGGVNCFSGADWDGSVICNDGWRDSYVSFYSSSECGASKYIYLDDLDQYNNIISGIQATCDTSRNAITSSYQSQIQKTEQDYLNLENSLKARLLKLGITPSDSSWSNAIDGNNQRLNDARQAIVNEMNSFLVESDIKCSSQKSVYIYNKDLYNKVCVEKLGAYSQFNKIKKECDCLSGYSVGYNPSSFSLACIKKSDCATGSLLIDGKCLSHTENCIATFGNNVYGYVNPNDSSRSLCECVKGYKWSVDRKSCVAQPAVVKQETKSNAVASSTITKKISYVLSEKNNLNIREKSSQTSRIIGTLKKKTKYEIVESTNKEWLKVKFGNKVGWVMKKLVKIY